MAAAGLESTLGAARARRRPPAQRPLCEPAPGRGTGLLLTEQMLPIPGGHSPSLLFPRREPSPSASSERWSSLGLISVSTARVRLADSQTGSPLLVGPAQSNVAIRSAPCPGPHRFGLLFSPPGSWCIALSATIPPTSLLPLSVPPPPAQPLTTTTSPCRRRRGFGHAASCGCMGCDSRDEKRAHPACSS